MSAKISVVMSVLNGAEFLRPAIDSILRQTLSDLELIVIDNCSVDDTPAILDSYSDPRLVRLRNDRVLSLPQSLNKGLSAARGTYVARLDADDIAASDRLELQARELDAHPDMTLVGCHYRTIDENDNSTGLHTPPIEPSALYQSMAFSNPFAHSAVMFRRDAAVAVGRYPERFVYAQDFALWQELARRGRVGMIGQPLVDIRKHSGQMTLGASYMYVRHHETIELFEQAQRLPGLRPQAIRAGRETLAMHHFAYAQALWQGGRLAAAAWHFTKSIWVAPTFFACKVLAKLGRSLGQGQ